MALTEQEQLKLDELIAGNEKSGAMFTAGQETGAIQDIYRNVYGQDATEDELGQLVSLATGKQSDFIRKLPELTSSFESLKYQQQGEPGKPVTPYKLGKLEQESLAERAGLPTSGQSSKSYTYWDEKRGVQVNAAPGQHFELYEGGGVKPVEGLIPRGQANTPNNSNFNQGTNAQGNVQGFQKSTLGYKPIDGKTILRTGDTIKNPKTGVDEYAGEGEVLIEYDDGTVERRKIGAEPGQATNIGEFGRTAEELGITRKTAIKGGPGGEVTRAPMSAAQALAAAKTPEEADAIITSEGGVSTKDLQLVGKNYRGKTAKDGYTYYVDPKTKEILERPESLQGLAQKLTIAGVAGTKIDVVDKFNAVFGRDPNQEELKYWLGRTDKAGSALIAAMQFAKQNGTNNSTAVATVDPVQNIKNQANAGQAKLAASLEEAGITGGSSELKALRAQIEAIKSPEIQSATEFTKEQLASSQFQEAQADLNRSKDALRKLDTDYRATLGEEELRGVSMTQVRRRQSAIDIAYNRTRAELVDEIQAYSDIVSSQTAVMGMMINAFQYDQSAAQTDYANRLNKATALYNMTAQEQQFEYTVQQDYVNNQRSNLSVISGLVAEGKIDYNNMSSEDKSNISKMEQAVGLQGLTQAISKTPIPNVTSVGSTIIDEDGYPQTQIISQDPRTGAISISYYKTPFKEKQAKGSGSGSGDILSGLGTLLSGVMGNDSEYEIVSDDSTDESTNLQSPPMTSLPGTKMEYPPGSGYIWEADSKGNWN